MPFPRYSLPSLKGLLCLQNLVRFKNRPTMGTGFSKCSAEPSDQESLQQCHLPAKKLDESTKSLVQKLKWRRHKAEGAYFFLLLCFLSSMIMVVNINTPGFMAVSEFQTNQCYEQGSNELQVILQFSIFVARDLSFGTAKMTDILVNFIIGQGGKALHGWIAYNIFADAITRSMETSPVPYVLYMTAKFNPTEFGSFLSYCKSILRASSMRQRWLVFWLAWATAHVLAWPILVASATGYFSPLEPYDRLESGLLATDVMFDFNTRAAYAEFPCLYQLPNKVNAGPLEIVEELSTPIFIFLNTTVSIVRDLKNYTIEHPMWKSRNCTSSYSSRTAMNENPVCVQNGGYIFGISSWMLVIILCLEVVWISGMFGVWYDAYAEGAMNKSGIRRKGVYRSALDISEAMVEDLGNKNSLFSDEELENALKGKSVRLGMTIREGSGNLHISTSSKNMGRPKVYLNRLYE